MATKRQELTQQYVESRSMPVPWSGCLIWMGTLSRENGYPRFGKFGVAVHRLVLGRKIGRSMSKNEFAIHSCDIPSCVNPEHLRIGSPKDNSTDMVMRGRSPSQHGEKNNNAKLTLDAVRKIRSSVGKTQAVLAAEFGCSQPVISAIRLGSSWRENG